MKRMLYGAFALLLVLGACGQRKSGAPATDAQEAAPADPTIVIPTDTLAATQAAATLPEEPVFDIVTTLGTIKIKLYKDTPLHRANFEKLALSGYYDSLLFHRVINGFMIQGGDPLTRDSTHVDMWGEGGPQYTIPAEFPVDAEGQLLHRHKKGALAAARRGDEANPFRESSGSQFYLVQDPDHCVHLDGGYTVYGETVAGLNVIDRIAATQTNRKDQPLTPVRILSVKPDEKMNRMGQ